MEQPGRNWPIGSRRGKPQAGRASGNRGALVLRVSLFALLLLVVAGVVYVVTSVSVVLSEIYDPLADTPSKSPGAVRATPVTPGERINILAMGLDDEGVRSDVMMLASIDVENRKIGVVQIPRDTRTRLAGKGTMEKINGAYAYGIGDKEFPAPLRAMKTVEDFLGVNVHYHVTVDMNAFKRIIDDVGGVWVEIPFLMEYDDPYQDLHIYFEPGRQKLNGEDALKFVRWRKNNDGIGYGDHGRIQAQQQVIRSLMGALFKPANLPFLLNQAVAVSRYVDSTVEPARLMSLAKLAVTLKPEDVEFATLPGVDAWLWDPQEEQRLAYFIADPEATQELVDRLVRGVDRSYNATVRVQVVPTDNPALADAIARRLAAQGYDLRAGDTAEIGHAPSVIRLLEHGNDPKKAQVVGRALAEMGHKVELVKAPESGTHVDVTVIVGPGS